MRARPLPSDWTALPDEELLDLRLADLPLTIEGTSLAARIDQLQAELAAHELHVPLRFYLSNEWFTADGTLAIAVPFYLAHPRLSRLEEAQMLEVEGGDHDGCLRILRHETGHAIDNAFRLRRRPRRRALFGSPATPYPEFYTPRPYSRSHVLHLDSWYAQSHPDEDFAETFAVWLAPDSDWRRRYVGWPALRKLEYLDGLMRELRGRRPLVDNQTNVDPLRHVRMTLRTHYRRKRRHYGLEHPTVYDRDLRRLFSDAPEFADRITAAQFIARVRKQARRAVAGWTGSYQYAIDQVIEAMVARCQRLKLRLAVPDEEARQAFTILLTVQTMQLLQSGGHRVAL